VDGGERELVQKSRLNYERPEVQAVSSMGRVLLVGLGDN